MIKPILARWNGEGICASLEDEDGDSIVIFETDRHQSPVRAAREAAGKLRRLADAFEKKASGPEPFKSPW